MSTTNHHASAAKTSKAPVRPAPPWWQTGVIYQIYVRSFYDSNGDGIGDLAGVTAKLGYLAELGIDGIWLSPVTKSANADWGYDTIDYYAIDPALGTMKDFDALLAAAKRHNIKVLLDLVPNHTSIKHPWFLNALTGRHAQYRNYYIWADPKKDGRPPSNWRAYGGGGAWQYHSPTGQSYLHNFFKEQADLNWRNPAVREEFDKIMRFWLDRGIAGFRIDVANMLIKDAQFRDNPKATKADGAEVRIIGQRPVHNIDQPEVHDILRHWRDIGSSYRPPALLLGESTLEYNIHNMAKLYGSHNELELAFNLKFLWSPFTAQSLREVVEETEDAIMAPDWPVWTGSNHDERRFPSDWAGGDEHKVRCALLMLLGLRGTPVLYYGDELGMEKVFVAPWRMKDPRGKRNWPVDGGRDQYRTPMPWKHQVGAGFTAKGVRPWLPYGDLKPRNVEAEATDADTTLRFTKDLIALRRRETDLQLGDYKSLPSAASVWLWRRGGMRVAINFSIYNHEIKDIHGEVVLATVRSREGERVEGLLRLPPWEGVIVR
jgi:alpha-glucosidase